MSFDVIVVGAGPAGVAAAVAFRRNAPWLSVALVEKSRFPREKPCGGGLTGLALDELRALGLALRVPAAWPARAEVRTELGGSRIDVSGRCAVVRRVELDADLAAQARERGVQLLEGCEVQAVERGPRGFEVATARGPLSARAVIAATGVAGLGRRAVRLGPGEKARLREAWSGRSPEPDRILFDFTAAARGLRGYAWTFPCGDGASNVGIYHLPARGACARLEELMEDHAAREGLATAGGVAYALRCFEIGSAAGAAGLLLAGEELGADPLTGEGIGYALWSGRLAGEEAAWALTAGRAPDPERYGARLLGNAPGRALVMLIAMARRLYGAQGADYRRLISQPAVAERIADLVIRRREPALVAARLVSAWASMREGA